MPNLSSPSYYCTNSCDRLNQDRNINSRVRAGCENRRAPEVYHLETNPLHGSNPRGHCPTPDHKRSTKTGKKLSLFVLVQFRVGYSPTIVIAAQTSVYEEPPCDVCDTTIKMWDCAGSLSILSCAGVCTGTDRLGFLINKSKKKPLLLVLRAGAETTQKCLSEISAALKFQLWMFSGEKIGRKISRENSY